MYSTVETIGNNIISKHLRSCDPNYFGDICVPASVLPCELIETFNQPITSGKSSGGRISNSSADSSSLDETLWWSTRGSQISDECGDLVGGTSLLFAGVRKYIFRNEADQYLTNIEWYCILYY